MVSSERKRREKVEGGRESTETTKPGIYAKRRETRQKAVQQKKSERIGPGSTCKPGQRKIGIGRRMKEEE